MPVQAPSSCLSAWRPSRTCWTRRRASCCQIQRRRPSSPTGQCAAAPAAPAVLLPRRAARRGLAHPGCLVSAAGNAPCPGCCLRAPVCAAAPKPRFACCRLCREAYPDPRSPDNPWEHQPYTDVVAVFYDYTVADTTAWQPDVQALLTTFSRMLQRGAPEGRGAQGLILSMRGWAGGGGGGPAFAHATAQAGVGQEHRALWRACTQRRLQHRTQLCARQRQRLAQK